MTQSPVYDRSIKMYDESYSPVQLENLIASGTINTGKFLTSEHAHSYLLQMQTITGLPQVKSVFELGPGEHYCARNLRGLGYEYVTFDFEPTHTPTIVGDWNIFDARKHPQKYDICCAFQVLEHFPWERFQLNLLKLALISTKYVLVSLPYSCFGYHVQTITHAGQGKTRVETQQQFFPTNLPQRKYRKEYLAEFPWAAHYWEIGRRGISVQDIFDIFKACNLEVISAFHSQNPYHYFILAQK